NFCEMLCARDADRDRKAQLLPHAASDSLGDFDRRSEEMRAAGDVGKGLVNGDTLDERGEVAQHIDGSVADALIVLEMTADKDEVRAEFARPPSRHPPMHAESLRLV